MGPIGPPKGIEVRDLYVIPGQPDGFGGKSIFLIQKLIFGPKKSSAKIVEHSIHTNSTRRIEWDGPELPISL